MVDDDGYLYIVDRLKDMIVSGGENIASSEVERVLYEHESVVEAAVVGRPDDRWGEVPVAYVVSTADRHDDARGAHRALPRRSSRKFKVPKEVVFVDELPRNPRARCSSGSCGSDVPHSDRQVGHEGRRSRSAMRSAGT